MSPSRRAAFMVPGFHSPSESGVSSTLPSLTTWPFLTFSRPSAATSGLREYDVLFAQYSRCQPLFIVFRFDCYPGLQYQRTTIQLLGDIMNTGSVLVVTCCQRSPVSVQSLYLGSSEGVYSACVRENAE